MRARSVERLGRVVAGVALALMAAHPAQAMAPRDVAEGPVVSVADDTAFEGAILRFAVSIDAPESSGVVVTATVTAGTAGSEDFTARSEAVEIPAGVTEAGFVVDTTDDSLDEPDETVAVTLTEPQNATIGDGGATGTIVDRSRVTVAEASVTEGETLRFPVRLDHAATLPVTVHLGTKDGTAVAPGDYTAVEDGTVTIPAGETEGSFDVATLGDALDESDETVIAEVLFIEGPASMATIGATGTIDDDDTPSLSVADASILEGFDLQFTVTLSAPAVTTVTVTATATAGTAGSGDFTARAESVEIPAGQVQAQFGVTTAEDTLDEPAETIAVTLSSPQNATIADGSATGTIVDKSRLTVATPAPVMEGGTLRFPVRLDHPAATQVTVQLGTQDGTALAPADYAAVSTRSLTIPAGQTEVFFDVATSEDIDEGEGEETVRARLLGSSGPASPSPLPATGTIQDKPFPRFTVEAATVTEGGQLVFPVRLTQTRISAVTVDLATEDATAQAPADYTPTSGTVTIPAGETAGQFVVPTVGDGFDEPDETVTVKVLRATNAFATLLRATGTIRDDDEPLPAVRLDAPAAVDEGARLRFPLRLDRAAPGPIDVRLSTTGGTATAPDDYTAQSLTLVRIPAGVTEAFLEVPTAEDELAESDETVIVDIKSGTNASLSVFRATGTIRDGAGPVRMVPGRVLGGRLVSGKILVRPPRSPRFLDLGAAAGLPVGTRVDARHGVLELASALGRRPVAFRARAAKTQRARVSGGSFTIRQARRSPLVVLELSGPELRRCRGSRGKAVRRLTADGSGRFAAKGRYATAEGSRGARWTTEDRCGSTRISVARGSVTVRDVRHDRAEKARKGRPVTVRPR